MPIRFLWPDDTHDDILDIPLGVLETLIAKTLFVHLNEIAANNKTENPLESIAMGLTIHVPLRSWNGRNATQSSAKSLITSLGHIARAWHRENPKDNTFLTEMFVDEYAADGYLLLDAFLDSMMLPSIRYFK